MIRRVIEGLAEVTGAILGNIIGTFEAMRVQRHLNMAALNPFIHERIAHYEKARKIMRTVGLPEYMIDTIINASKNEAG